jgi:hypothetical protein
MNALKGRVLREGKRVRVSHRSIKEASVKYGIPYITLYKRLENGWTLADAIRKPVRPYIRKPVAVVAPVATDETVAA